jgi:hypothetical protein
MSLFLNNKLVAIIELFFLLLVCLIEWPLSKNLLALFCLSRLLFIYASVYIYYIDITLPIFLFRRGRPFTPLAFFLFKRGAYIRHISIALFFLLSSLVFLPLLKIYRLRTSLAFILLTLRQIVQPLSWI